MITTDGSQAAASATELGLEITQATGDEVLFVSVWDMIRGRIGAPFGYIDQSTSMPTGEQPRRAYLRDGPRPQLGVAADSCLLFGEPVSEICTTARHRNVRMIVIGAHGCGALQSMIHGGGVTGGLRYASCPVLTGAG